MKTRHGIYYDLTKSVYIFKSRDTKLNFVFSSDLHLTKFEEQIDLHRESFNKKMYARYRVEVEFNLLADIILYKKIETRGFLIVNEWGKHICLNDLRLICDKGILKE